MRILVYKRTHKGDPDVNGCFGVHDCMGSKRNLEYNVVIGVGGTGREAIANGIAGRINWIGVGSHKYIVSGKRGPEVRFDHFLDFGDSGPEFSILAPTFAQYFYSKNVRYKIVSPDEEKYDELHNILMNYKKALGMG